MQQPSIPSSATPDRDLADYLLVLWRWKGFVAVCTAAAVVVVVAASLVLPRVYRATGTVMLVESKVSETAPSRPSGDYQALHEIVRQLLVNEDNLTAVIKTVPELASTTPEKLARKIETETQSFSPVVTVRFEASRPEIARRVLAEVMNRAVALNADLTRQELSASREYLKAQVEASREAMAAAEATLLAFTTRARLSDSREMIKVLLERKRVLMTKLDEARVALSAAAAEAGILKKTLEGRQERVTLSRSVLDDPVVQQLAKPRQGTTAGLTVATEEWDPVSLAAQQRLGVVSGAEAAAKAQADTIGRELDTIERELVTRQAEVAEKDSTFERLVREYELTRDTYKGFVRRFEDARVLVASRAPDLKILNPATASSRPVWPRPLVNGFAAGVAAFLLAVCAAFVADWLGARGHEAKRHAAADS